jgi:hypothetical protein
MLNLFPEAKFRSCRDYLTRNGGPGPHADRAPAVGQEIPAAWQAEAYAAVQTSEAFW